MDTRVSRRRVRAFARAVGATHPAYYDPYDAGYFGYRDVIAPSLFAYTLSQPFLDDVFSATPRHPARSRQAESQDLVNGYVNPNALVILHGLHMQLNCPIVAGQLLSVEFNKSIRKAADWSVVTCETRVSDSAAALVSIKATYGIARGLKDPAISRSAGKPPKREPQDDEGGVVSRRDAASPQPTGPQDDGDGVVSRRDSDDGGGDFRADIAITQSDVSDFCAASGDLNPIHLDAKAAQAVGLPDIISPGILLLGKALSDIESYENLILPKTIQARFLSPIVVPQNGARIATDICKSENKTELSFAQNGARLARATLSF